MRERERRVSGLYFHAHGGEVASEGSTKEPRGVTLLFVVIHELLKLFQFGSKID